MTLSRSVLQAHPGSLSPPPAVLVSFCIWLMHCGLSHQSPLPIAPAFLPIFCHVLLKKSLMWSKGPASLYLSLCSWAQPRSLMPHICQVTSVNWDFEDDPQTYMPLVSPAIFYTVFLEMSFNALFLFYDCKQVASFLITHTHGTWRKLLQLLASVSTNTRLE